MKKKNYIIVAVLILVLSVFLNSCGSKDCGCSWYVKCDCSVAQTTAPDINTISYDESEQNTTPTPESSLKKGVLYYCGDSGLDSSSASAYYNKLENNFKLPDVEQLTKENAAQRTIILSGREVVLTYNRSYRPQYMSYYLDEYVNDELSVEVDFLENTDIIYNLRPGDIDLFATDETPVTENDYMSICREFMNDNIKFGNYQLYRLETLKTTYGDYGVDNDKFNEFVTFSDTDDNTTVRYTFYFVEYFGRIMSSNSVMITLNQNGSLVTFLRAGSDDYSSYSSSVIDMDYITDALDDGINGMFNVDGYTLTDYSDFSVLMVIEGKLCVMSMITPTVKIESTGKTVSLSGTITLLLPLT